jgi:ubiquinone/menaquinone biosynthesis C-methylase UbiE
MQSIKALIKQLFFASGFSPFLDNLLFKFKYFNNKKKNLEYANTNSNIKFPPDYYLYETYKLDYQTYIEDGNLSAQEIIDWTNKYLAKNNLNILEWGCGVSRTCRHLYKYVPSNSKIFACDINKEMIDWNTNNIEEITFSLINYNPPTSYETNKFNLIFGISVFTHIDTTQQENWLVEIHRILAVGGIFLFSTHGNKYFTKLLKSERQKLNKSGSVTKNYYQKGHRLMSTCNKANFLKNIVEKYFNILEYYNGESHLEKLGGQDMWIVQKK